MSFVTENLSELWIISAGFDDLLVNGDTTDGDGNTYTIDAIDDGASWDNPVPVDVAVQRWMTDGAVAATQGHENRTPTFQVRITADTSSALAAAEAALVKRSAQPCLLKWVPPEGAPDAPASIFEVWTWHLSHAFSGTDERHLQRYYTLTFTAKPWVRSESLTTAVAPIPPGVPTTVSIDPCTSTTGWSAAGTGPLSVVLVGGTSVRTGPIGFTYGGVHQISMTRTGSVTGLSATPYLILDAVITGGGSQTLAVSVDFTSLTKAAQIGTLSYWRLPAGMTSFSTMSVFATAVVVGSGTITLTISDVSRTDTIGGVGSAKQVSRHLEVGGSVQTSGSIHLASPTSTALGTCLVYTSPDDGSGFSPPLRGYRTSGNTVTLDGTCVSGNREAFVNSGATAGTIFYDIPASVLPEATYVLVGRFIFGSAATMVVSATSNVGATGFLTTGNVVAPAAGPRWGVIGTMQAPCVSLPAETALTVSIHVAASADTGTHTVDELYLLDVTHGSFTLVTGVTGTHLWLDAPDADTTRNRPAIYSGTQLDRSDAATPNYATVLSVGDHDLDPRGSTLLTVTDVVDSALADASFYRRWHTHAGS